MASKLRINSFEIRNAIGFDHHWLTGLKVSFLCLCKPEYRRLSRLLDKVYEHNHLASKIAPDIKNASNSKQITDRISDLNKVIKVLFRIKENILRALKKDRLLRENSYYSSKDKHTKPIPVQNLKSLGNAGVYEPLLKQALELARSLQDEIV